MTRKPPRFGSNLIQATALCLALLSSCLRKPADPVKPAQLDPAVFDGVKALDEAKKIVELGPRDAATPGSEAAAKHLRDRLRALGVEASIDEFKELSPKGEVVFRNVIGRLPGRGEGRVILGSHFDTKSGIGEKFQGANDSASSSAALLELARVLAQGPKLPIEVMFAFFDGEECMAHYGPSDGLHGSRHLAKKLIDEGRGGDIKAMILLDMIGDRDLTVTIPRNSAPALIEMVFEAAREDGVREKFALFPLQIGDDHDPFFSAGIPAIDLIDFYYGSAPGRNDYWHTEEDRIDKISAESLGVIGRVALRLLNQLIAEQPGF
jgi:glutaminyl-peptide cyclotransferase